MSNRSLVGWKFGRLEVKAPAISDMSDSKWVCVCRCGKEIIASYDDLFSHRVRSCGTMCERHGKSGTPEYRVWQGILQRCCNPNEPNFKHYGARGIQVCDRWFESFESFYEDMGPRPGPKYTINRRNNDGDYTPENCHWATHGEQLQNTSRNQHIDLDGETLVLAELARRAKVDSTTMKHRIKAGWSTEDLMKDPSPEKFTLNGKTLTLTQWAKELGIKRSTLQYRIKVYKWPLEKALSK